MYVYAHCDNFMTSLSQLLFIKIERICHLNTTKEELNEKYHLQKIEALQIVQKSKNTKKL